LPEAKREHFSVADFAALLLFGDFDYFCIQGISFKPS